MLKLAAEKRDLFGKQLRGSRLAGKMPVVLYGPKDQPVSLSVPVKEFKKILREAGESTMITVESTDLKKDVLIHDVAFHPTSGEPLHADLYVVDKTKTITIEVPLNFTGIAPAVKDLGGTLVKVLHDLKIEVLPMDIPHEIPVDISQLSTLESQILVKDLALPQGVKVLNELDAVVASVSVAKEEPVEEAPVDLESIEVEKKGKKEEEGEAAAEEAPAAKE